MRLPKPITLRVGRKLADKSKDEIMTEVLRVFAGLEVKAIQVAYEVVRVTFALRSISGHPNLIRVSTFLVYGVPSWGWLPCYVHARL